MINKDWKKTVPTLLFYASSTYEFLFYFDIFWSPESPGFSVPNAAPQAALQRLPDGRKDVGHGAPGPGCAAARAGVARLAVGGYQPLPQRGLVEKPSRNGETMMMMMMMMMMKGDDDDRK